MIRLLSRAVPVALLASFALTACAPGGKPLAVVGGRRLTVDDFERAARGSEGQYPAPAEIGRRALLEDLLKRELMLAAVHARGADTTAEIRNLRRSTEDKLILQALYEAYAPRDPGVSDAEAHAFYALRDSQADVSLVYASNPRMIHEAAARLAQGASFASVADRFNVVASLPPGGHLGFVTPGSMLEPIDTQLRTLPAGVVGGPFESAQGYFLVRIARRKPNPQPPYELIQMQLVEMLRERKQRELITRAIGSLREQWHLELAPNAGNRLFQILAPYRTSGVPFVPPSTAEKREVLVTWAGGGYTLGEALDDLQNQPGEKPLVTMQPVIETWLEGQALTHIALAEARRRHIDQDPDVAARVRTEVERALLDAEYQRVTAGVAAPDDATVRALWEGMRLQYPQLTSARVQWVNVADSATAMRLGMSGGHGGRPLAAAARETDPKLVAHDATISYPSRDAQWQSARDALARMTPGQWTGPSRTPAGWRVIQLVDRTLAPVDYDQLEAQQKERLSSMAYQAAGEHRFERYIDSLRIALHPVVMPENLASIPWPAAAAAAP